MPKLTKVQLQAMSSEKRLILRNNALTRGGPEAEALIALLDSLHLPIGSSGGMPLTDPIFVEMRDIAWSEEGVAAMLNAVESGLPALAGLDPLLQAKMGGRYRIEGQGRESAGVVAAEVMRHRGYEQAGDAKLPAGCLAGRGATWRMKTSLKD